jgi:hypothetical protein
MDLAIRLLYYCVLMSEKLASRSDTFVTKSKNDSFYGVVELKIAVL